MRYFTHLDLATDGCLEVVLTAAVAVMGARSSQSAILPRTRGDVITQERGPVNPCSLQNALHVRGTPCSFNPKVRRAR
jgi:hypothetical protein